MPYPNEHAARIRAPGDFARIKQLWSKGGIRAIGGPLQSSPSGPSKVQAIRFNKGKWAVSEARKWLKDHKYKVILFERARGEKKSVKPPDQAEAVKSLTYEMRSVFPMKLRWWAAKGEERDAIKSKVEAAIKSITIEGGEDPTGSGPRSSHPSPSPSSDTVNSNALVTIAGSEKQDEPDGDKIRVDFAIKAVDAPQHIISGIVYPADTPDTDNDMAGASAIREAMVDFMKSGPRFADGHGSDIEATVVENFQAEKETVKDGSVIPAGAWYTSIFIPDDDIIERARKGEINGYSWEGLIAGSPVSGQGPRSE